MAFIGKQPTPSPLSSSDITDAIITNAKLAQDIISAETELATAPASTDELLISDDGVLKRIDVSLVGGQNTPAFHVVRSSSQSISTNTNTKVQFNSEVFDTDNTFDSSTNYRFTPGVSGKYFLYAGVRPNENDDFNESQVYIRKNNSDIVLASKRNTYSDTVHAYTTIASDTDDYFEVFYYHQKGSSLNLSGDANSYTYFGGYKIIE
tara:strand:- start:397 stop:1017 length:621 start_codon:yes stop_codon:yes gene_type:complete